MGNLPAIFKFSHVKSGGKVTFPDFSATFSSSARDKPRSSHGRKHAGLNNHNNVFYLRAAWRKTKNAHKDCLLFFFFSPPSEYQNGLPCHRRGEAMTPPPHRHPKLLGSKLEDLSHHPHFSSNLEGSKVASWVWAGSRWLHARRDPAKALQVLTPPLPWVPGWGGSGLGKNPT